MLVDPRAMLRHAVDHSYAIGAYDLIDTAMLAAIIAGAEAAAAPLILSIAEPHTAHFDEAALMAAVLSAAQRTPLPVAIHYDHGTTLAALTRATRLGYTSLMLDLSHLPYDQNLAQTRIAAQLAHAVGLPLEAELGYVPGEEGQEAALHPGPIRYTDPEEAHRFVLESGCDWLAVSIGTVHGRFRGEPQLDYTRLAAIRSRLPATPLVIHGGTGLTDDQYRALIEAGANKINYYTALVEAAGAAARLHDRWDQQQRAAHTAIAREVERTARLWGAAGQADAVLAVAPPITPVEHVILHRWQGTVEALEQMRCEGLRTLGALPGVLRVAAGDADRPNAPYPHLWTMTFATPQALAAFRADPIHQRFADTRFRPYAQERITTDYPLTHGLGPCVTPKSSQR
ncbi:MAG: class II fructose-bisphosphate aldolase [Hydrogenophilus sp.]|nr:class II fructose-bisphosphate aldolase [Hydrogenophilus sp.]